MTPPENAEHIQGCILSVDTLEAQTQLIRIIKHMRGQLERAWKHQGLIQLVTPDCNISEFSDLAQ